MPRKLMVALLLALPMMALAGCWDRWEIEDRGFVTGVGLDLAPPEAGQPSAYRVTMQIVDPKATSGGKAGGGGGGGGGAETQPFWNLTSTSRSVFEAVREAGTRSDREPYFEHMRVIVIGEDLARHGIREALDFFSREPEIRWKVRVYVTPGEARKVLEVKPRQEVINATYLFDLAQNELRINVFSPMTDLGMVARALNDGTAVVLPRVEPGKEEVRLAGSAVFKGDRLAGWLDESETRGLRWVKNRVRGGTVVVQHQGEAHAFSIDASRTRVRPRLVDGYLSFTVDIWTEGYLAEDQSRGETFDSDFIDGLQRDLARQVEREVREAVRKAQQDFMVDIFGFGRELERRFPGVWKQIEDRWEEEIFPAVPVEVRARVYIRRIGVVR